MHIFGAAVRRSKARKGRINFYLKTRIELTFLSSILESRRNVLRNVESFPWIGKMNEFARISNERSLDEAGSRFVRGIVGGWNEER